jgi:flagellar hook-basal body complex protein FliE
MPSIDPSMVTIGREWSIGLEEAGAAAPQGGGASFGRMLADQVQSLADLQTEASGASRDLALGQAEDPTGAVLAVERARLAMQLATSVRTKLTEAVNDVMRTQV